MWSRAPWFRCFYCLWPVANWHTFKDTFPETEDFLYDSLTLQKQPVPYKNTHSSFLLVAKKHVHTRQSWIQYPLRMKTTLYLFLRGNKSLLYHQIDNRNFFIFITIQWNLMFCVDKIKYEHLAILSNLKSCQFAPRILIFNLCICCQFEDSQIILPKIIPMSHRNI